MTTKIVELIYTEERRGKGTQENPTRLCAQLFSKDGNLVAELDPMHHQGGTTDTSEDNDWFHGVEFNPRNIDNV